MMDSASAVLWLALAVFNEARSEPLAGQIAVAEVVLNRTTSSCYPDTVRSTVLSRNQFSWVQRGGYLTMKAARAEDEVAWNTAYRVAVRTYILYLLHDSKTTARYTHFHTVDSKPAWSSKGIARRRIGNHIFMRLPC